MTLANQIRNQLARYTSNDLDMRAFRDWFAPVLRDVHKSGEADAESLAHAVEWEFLDFERGVSSEVFLKENLSRLASVAVANPPVPHSSDIAVQAYYFPVAPPKTRVFEQNSGNGDQGNGSLVVVESNGESSLVFSDLVLTSA